MPIDTVGSLLDALTQNRLLEAGQLDEAKTLRGRFTDARAFAKELIQRGWLTPFQANQVLANRGGDLVLGNYVVIERLGEGGMGVVYKARNWKIGRIVAIKVIRKERLSNPQALKRFQREIHAASSLNHPNVVIAFDADQVADTHIFAMEYIEGVDLARLVKEKGPLPVARACEYIRQAALGLQHASDKGLVHRDIKPNNLLVTKDAKGNHVVKVLDMGLARVIETEDTTLTKEGSVMGTPDYIAPEQARDAHKADIRADLYSLGCTFFFLLTGQVPFQGGSLTEKLLKHYIEPPPPVQKLRPEVPPGVAAILHKLMEKKPSDRFQTPNELADALAELIGPDGKLTAKANRGGMVIPTGLKKKNRSKQQTAVHGKSRRKLVLAVMVIGMLGAGLLGMTMLGGGSAEPTTSSEIAQGKGTPATGRSTSFTPPTRVSPPTNKIDPGTKGALTPLDGLSAAEILAENRIANLPAEAVAVMGEHRGRHYGGPVPSLVFSPDGQALASAGPDGIRIWNASDMRQQAHLKVTGAYGVAISADGGVVAVSNLASEVHFYSMAQLTGEPYILKADGPAQGPAYGLAFSPVGRTLALARAPTPQDGRPGSGQSIISIWDCSGQPRQTATMRHNGAVYALAFAPGGQQLASAGQDGIVRIWEVNGEARHNLNGHVKPVRGLTYLTAGVVASGSDDGTIRIWNANTGKPAQPPITTAAMVFSLAYSHQGSSLLAGQSDYQITAYRWNPKQGAQVASRLRDQSAVTAVAVDPRRQYVAAGSINGTVRIWDWGEDLTERSAPNGHLSSVLALDFTPDGGSLASASLDGSVKLWDMNGPQPQERDLRANLGGMSMAAVALDGRRLAAIGPLGQVRLWDLPGASVSRDVQNGANSRFNFPGGIAFSPDSQRLATTGSEIRQIRIWELREGQSRLLTQLVGHEGQVSSVAFAADGNTLASASSGDGTVRVWNLANQQTVRQFSLNRNQPLTSLAFSADGRLLAFGTTSDRAATEGVVRIGAVQGNAPPRDIRAHKGMVWAVAFAPRGDTLASAGDDGRLVLWEAGAGRKLREWQLGGPAYSLRFSPDGRYLAVGNANGTIYILRL